MILRLDSREQFLAAAVLWDEIRAEGFEGLGCGAPPPWFYSISPEPIELRSLSDRSLKPRLANRFQAYTQTPRDLIENCLNNSRAWSKTDRCVISLGESLAWLAAAVTMLWSQDEKEVSVIIAKEMDDVAKYLDREGEVIILAHATDLTHNRLDSYLSYPMRCEVGFLTARQPEDITWHWHKPRLWSLKAERQCAFIDWQKRSLLRWLHGAQKECEEPVTVALLEEVLGEPLLLLSLMGHGSGIDMDLGGVGLLCGQTRRAAQMASADDGFLPVCAINTDFCPRNRAHNRRIFKTDEISTSFLFANTCLGVALGDSIYSSSLSMGLGITDGPTGVFLGAHRVRYIEQGENALVESCVQSGMTAGAVSRYLNQSVNKRGEPASFILMGRPDFKAIHPHQALPIQHIPGPEILAQDSAYLIQAGQSKLLRISDLPPALSVQPVLKKARAAESRSRGYFCSAVENELWIYGEIGTLGSLELRPAAMFTEHEMLARWWRALSYWRMQYALLCKAAGDGGINDLSRQLVDFEQFLIARADSFHRRIQQDADQQSAPFRAAAAQAERLAETLDPLVDDIFKRHTKHVIDSLFQKSLRTLEEATEGSATMQCGCGKPLRRWRLESLFSADLNRWSWECASCGIVLDAPRQQSRLSYLGPADIYPGERIFINWAWSSGAQTSGQPRIYTAMVNKICDMTLIRISPATARRGADGSFIFSQTIQVADGAEPEAYWFYSIVFADLELTCALQLIRIRSPRQ